MSAGLSHKEEGDGGYLGFHRLLAAEGPGYLERFGAAMPPRQSRVLRRMLRCRSPALGGQLFGCMGCGKLHYRYHSCNDRHCPQCGGQEAEPWARRWQARLPAAASYFLVTFTVPAQLRGWLRAHPRVGYDALFGASAQAMQALARNPERMGASLGFLGVLHTWSRTLGYHPHIHYLVPGGGLSAGDERWIAAPEGFLLPVRPLAEHFANCLRAQLQKQAPEALAVLPSAIWRLRWVVHSKAVGNGEKALGYLSRYVFKTATGNRRLPVYRDGRIGWPYRDSNSGQPRCIKFQRHELIRRFLQHVLPRGYSRVRSFGWLHPAQKQRLERVRKLLPQKSEQPEPPAASPTPAPICARCRCPMSLLASWRAGQTPPGAQARAPP